MTKKLTAEFLGTLWFVLTGCGSAVIAAGIPNIGIGLIGIAFAFGLAYLSMAAALQHISGAHFNPAVTVGAWARGEMRPADAGLYIAVQLLGALAGAGILYYIAMGIPGFALISGLNPNGFDTHSLAQFDIWSSLVAEFAITCGLVIVYLTTARRGSAALMPVAVGLTIVLINLFAIPITNASANPARTTATALISLLSSTWPIQQLWLFWVAPVAGGLAAGFLMRWLDNGTAEARPDVEVTVIATE